jgi:hypothetical protein
MRTENYEHLLEELTSILVERRFQARDLKLRTMHDLGLSVLTSPLYEGNTAALLRQLSDDLPVGRSEFYASVQFAQAVPDVEGFLSAHADKRLSWAQVKRDLLPENPTPRLEVDRHAARAFSLSMVGEPWTEAAHAELSKLIGLTSFPP